MKIRWLIIGSFLSAFFFLPELSEADFRNRWKKRLRRLKPTKGQGSLRMAHCSSVKVAALAAKEVYSVWAASRSGRVSPPKRRYGGLKLVDSYFGGRKRSGFAALFVDRGRCILSFKGTDFRHKNDVFADLRSWRRVKCRGFFGRARVGDCGRGFSLQFQAMIRRGKLLKRLRSHLRRSCSKKPLLVTGHSLGGAHAALFAATAAASLPRLSRRSLTVTFGAPRVFSRSDGRRLHRLLHKRVLRVVSYGDPITSLPRSKSMNFHHFGTTVYMTTRGPLSKIWTFVRKHANFSAFWNPSTASKHKMVNYLTRVNRCRK